ncbi:MAG: (2Fe-2S)-binding protein, partial [Bdellovibrionales bacterium]|nr:(2Fe-2S)-binding protein [Bdellovibrionales bacterium]
TRPWQVNSMSEFKVKILPSNKVLECKSGQILLEQILTKKIPISHSCGGMGTCGTCRVVIKKTSNDLFPRTDIEAEMAQDRGFAENERLACQLEVNTDLEVEIPS